MKARLEFNLPEDGTDFRHASMGGHLHNVIWEFDQWLRNQLKYPVGESTQAREDALQECRDKLREFIEDNGVGDLFV